MADATAAVGRPLHYLVPEAKRPPHVGRTRMWLHVCEEPAPFQVGTARVRELRLSHRALRSDPENAVTKIFWDHDAIAHISLASTINRFTP